MSTEHIPGRLIDLDTVDVIDSRPFEPDAIVRRGDWICAACGQRRPIEGSWQVTVRNRSGMSLERPVLVCSGCRGRLVARDGQP